MSNDRRIPPGNCSSSKSLGDTDTPVTMRHDTLGLVRYFDRLGAASLHWSTTIPSEGEVWRELDERIRGQLDACNLRFPSRRGDGGIHEWPRGLQSFGKRSEQAAQYSDLAWALVKFHRLSDGRVMILPDDELPSSGFESSVLRARFEEVSQLSVKGRDPCIWISEYPLPFLGAAHL